LLYVILFSLTRLYLLPHDARVLNMVVLSELPPRSSAVPALEDHMKEAFKDACMTRTFMTWFNHVIKVRDTDVINVPIVYLGSVLPRDKMSAILIEVKKNYGNFGKNIHDYIYDGMDPFNN
jgi:hypothetical protein